MNKPNSFCFFYYPNKKLKMKGYFKNARKHGKVFIYGINRKLEFKKDGPGTEYNENGKVIRKGIWENDIYILAIKI